MLLCIHCCCVATQATRAVFVALLKHANPSKVPVAAAMADAKAPEDPINEVCVVAWLLFDCLFIVLFLQGVRKIWEKAALRVRPQMNEKKGKGEDVQPYVDAIVLKAKFLLRLDSFMQVPRVSPDMVCCYLVLCV